MSYEFYLGTKWCIVVIISPGGEQIIPAKHTHQFVGLVETKMVTFFLILPPRSNLVACQVADVNGGWSTLPALKQARWDWFFISPYSLFASGVLFKSSYFRADHGCAVIKDSKGRTGILVVGGVGDKVDKTFQIIHNSFQSCVASSVEFLALDTDGSEWETMPNLRNPRCCSPKVTSLSILARMTVYEWQDRHNLLSSPCQDGPVQILPSKIGTFV